MHQRDRMRKPREVHVRCAEHVRAENRHTREPGKDNPSGGGSGISQREGANLQFDQFFSENCMKIKKFWPIGAHVPCCTPPPPPTSANAQARIIQEFHNVPALNRRCRTNYIEILSLSRGADPEFLIIQGVNQKSHEIQTGSVNGNQCEFCTTSLFIILMRFD